MKITENLTVKHKTTILNFVILATIGNGIIRPVRIDVEKFGATTRKAIATEENVTLFVFENFSEKTYRNEKCCNKGNNPF